MNIKRINRILLQILSNNCNKIVRINFPSGMINKIKENLKNLSRL